MKKKKKAKGNCIQSCLILAACVLYLFGYPKKESVQLSENSDSLTPTQQLSEHKESVTAALRQAEETAVKTDTGPAEGTQPAGGEQAEPAGQTGGTAAAVDLSGLVNINTADIEALKSLTGIGPAKAQNIISYRESNGPFSSKEEIMNVPGIKEGTYSKICDYIYVD